MYKVTPLMGVLNGDRRVSSTFMGRAIKLENFTLFLFAYTFGIISPNRRRRKVITPTSTINLKSIPNKVVFILEKYSSVRRSNSRTMAIFTVLLATRIVASNFLGLSSSLTIIFCVSLLLPFSVMKLAGVREKNATSAPEISAEQIRRTNSIIMLKIIE